MADFQDYSVTPKQAAQVNTQTHELAGRILDSETQVVLADFTGANAKSWPACLNLLSPELQNQIVADNAQRVLLALAGVG